MEKKSLFNIAVIGIGCQFPGSRNHEEFWKNLLEGKELIRKSDQNIGKPVEPQTNYVNASSDLDDVDAFDAEFFGYSKKEAEMIDPQHRLFLQIVWAALEDAGINSSATHDVGLFASSGAPTYLLNNLRDILNNTQRTSDLSLLLYSNIQDYLPSKVSYKFNFTGPSIAIQSACSSSLAALHTACLYLQCYQCEIAVAGGVSLTLPQKSGYLFEEGSILSRDGHCRVFSKEASGTVFGSGAGAVVLKRLEEAIKDKDNIYAVIKGTAVNNDGHEKVGYTAPSESGQAAVIKKALATAGINANQIHYVECHGTGTVIGDHVELSALHKVFGTNSSKNKYCFLGSVKSNLGHTLASAGMAGFIKTVLSLKNSKIPPSLHYKNDNELLESDRSPFSVNLTTQSFESPDLLQYACVSSFGIGGTNAHVVLARHKEAEELTVNSQDEHFIIPVSGKDSSSLERNASNLMNYILSDREFDIGNAAFTLQTGRVHFGYRKFFIVDKHRRLIMESEAVDNKNYLMTKEHLINENEISDKLNLATLWLHGSNIDWNKCYKIKRKKISLPTYSFSKNRHWISSNKLEICTPSKAEPLEEGNNLCDVMLDIWREVLGDQSITIHDSFFEKGGHSLHAVQIISRLQERMQISLQPTIFFQAETIQSQLELI